jgi:hypothetical protein
MKDDFQIDKGDGTIRSLYKLGGIAALIVAALTLGEIIFFIFFPPPETIRDWFSLFQSNALIGLLDFWGLEIPMYLMFIPVFLALYMHLRKTNHSWMVIALACALLGVAIFLATNNPFSMLTLSKLHADATTEAQQSVLLAAGQTILANTNQRAVGGFNIALLLVSVAGLITSLVMLQDHHFSRTSAIIGILAFALSLADYLRQALTQSLIIALPLILLGALFIFIWFILIGLKLFQLGRHESETQPAV